MANIGSLFVDVDANTSGLEAGLARAQRATQKFSQSARRAAGGFSRIAKESQLAVPPIGNMTRLLGTLSGYLGARQIVQYADAWNNAGNQLRQVTNTASELANVQETLMGVANDTRSEFESTANLYSRLARSTTEMGLSQKDLIGLTKTINQSFAVSGATAGEAAAAITQLSQGLAAGALRGDEFNSVSEQAPALMRAIAESLDMTIGELREFAAEGGITAEIVVKALQESADEIENNFGKAIATFGQQMTVARNNMLQFVGGSNDLNEALSNLGGAAITASENLDLAAKALGALAALVAGRIVGRLYAMAAGMTAAAGAATALRTALAFLGGPIGILVGAGGLLFTFREELGLVPKQAKSVAENVDEITRSLEGMSGAMLDVQVAAFGAELVQIELQAERLQTRIESLQEAANDPASFGQGQQGDIRSGLTRAQAEQAELTNRAQGIEEAIGSLDRFRRSTDEVSESSSETASKLMETNEQAGRLTDTAIKSATELAKHGESSRKATESVDNFANAAQSAATRMASIAQSRDPRYGFDPDEGTSSSRARARFEASANRIGDPNVINLGGNPDATRTWSTAAYDAAGSAPSMGRAANEAMQSSQRQSMQRIGELMLTSDKGSINVFTENPDAANKWLADTLSGNAAAS